MLKSGAILSKRILSLTLFAVMIFSMCPVSVFAASNSNSAERITGKYTVPIISLVSAAPIPSVKTAFAKAFGDSVVVTVYSDGTKTALIKSKHMVIDFMSKSYEANVASIVDADASTDEIEKATVISTKHEVYNAGLKASKTTAITVPDKFSIPLNLDGDNSQKLSITVDFMDAFMGSGKPFPTKVTLTLDMDSAVIDVSELNALIDECESIVAENHTDDTLTAFNETIAKAKVVAANPKSFDEIKNTIAKLNKAKSALKKNGENYTSVDKTIASIPEDLTVYTTETSKAVTGADYTSVDKAIASIPEDLTAYTTETSKAVTNAVNAVERGLPAEKQPQVDAMALAITQAISSLKKTSSDDSNENGSNIGIIGIISAVALLAVIGICVCYFCFYKKRKNLISR